MSRRQPRAIRLHNRQLQRGTRQDGWVPGPLPSEVPGYVDVYGVTETWIGPTMSVQIAPVRTCLGEVLHMVLRRHDGSRLFDWREMQDAKDLLAGPGREAVEVFPQMLQVVDDANLRHLWVLPKGTCLPFGLAENRHG